ncbi:hypothetical protein B0H67DRAFT_595903, partial [Lasiosphaeris hirsuta]
IWLRDGCNTDIYLLGPKTTFEPDIITINDVIYWDPKQAQIPPQIPPTILPVARRQTETKTEAGTVTGTDWDFSTFPWAGQSFGDSADSWRGDAGNLGKISGQDSGQKDSWAGQTSGQDSWGHTGQNFQNSWAGKDWQMAKNWTSTTANSTTNSTANWTLASTCPKTWTSSCLSKPGESESDLTWISWTEPGQQPHSQSKIPRPRNKFMLYRQWKAKSMRKENPGLTAGVLSKLIGEMWRSEDASVIRHFSELAKQEDKKHKEKYPGYQYARTEPRKPLKYPRGHPKSIASKTIETTKKTETKTEIETQIQSQSPYRVRFREVEMGGR